MEESARAISAVIGYNSACNLLLSVTNSQLLLFHAPFDECGMEIASQSKNGFYLSLFLNAKRHSASFPIITYNGLLIILQAVVL